MCVDDRIKIKPTIDFDLEMRLVSRQEGSTTLKSHVYVGRPLGVGPITASHQPPINTWRLSDNHIVHSSDGYDKPRHPVVYLKENLS